MKLAFLGLASLALGIAIPAAAMTDQPAATPKPKKERRICKTMIRSGSNLSTTRCKTHAEWLALETTYGEDGEIVVPGNRTTTSRNIEVGALPQERFRLPGPR